MSFEDRDRAFREIPWAQTHADSFQPLPLRFNDSNASRSFGDTSPFSGETMRSFDGSHRFDGRADAVQFDLSLDSHRSLGNGDMTDMSYYARSKSVGVEPVWHKPVDTATSNARDMQRKLGELPGRSPSPTFDLSGKLQKLGVDDSKLKPGGGLAAPFAGANHDEFLEFQQLEIMPSYYEKFSSFFTKSTPAALLLHLNAVFSSMEGVDHDLKPSKCKIKGFANGLTGRCAFKVTLFRQEQQRMLCEFQRRSGCVVYFNKFWRKTLGSLAVHSPTFPDGVYAPGTSVDCGSLPAGFAECGKPLLDAETVNRLAAMAGCDNVDVQREGLAALAAISQIYSLAAALPQLLPLLEKLLLDNDDELCRNACVFLANLCTYEECRTCIVSNLLSRMVELLGEPGHLGRRDSKRQVARALFECSKTDRCKTELTKCVPLLQRFETTTDSTLRTNILGTLRHLQPQAC